MGRRWFEVVVERDEVWGEGGFVEGKEGELGEGVVIRVVV